MRERAEALPARAEIFARTGLSKGSLCHFSSGAKKAEMAAAVRDEIDAWRCRE